MIKTQRLFCVGIYVLMFIARSSLPVLSQQEDPVQKGQGEDIMTFMEEGMNEIDYYSLEELLNVEVEVASLFAEDELVVGSTVSSITSDKWKQLGARRTHEALNNEMSVLATPFARGSYSVFIRGYANTFTQNGIAYLIDGVPLNEMELGAGMSEIPNWQLGILDRIEMIKGPGSAIYGSDAFHGVISMKTFESDNNFYSAELAGAYPPYGDANLKVSQGLMENLIRIDTAVSASHQGDQGRAYTYDEVENNIYTGRTLSDSRELKYDSSAGVLKARLNPEGKLNAELAGYFNSWDCEDFHGIGIGVSPSAGIDSGLSIGENDRSSGNSMFYLGKGTLSYSLPGQITMESTGYYWTANSEYTIDTAPPPDVLKQIVEKEFRRTGASLIVKQPDNALNLQWLAAYSYSHSEISSLDENIYYNGLEFPNPLPSSIDKFKRDIHSVFSQLKWGAVRDRFYLIAGGRLDRYSDVGNQITPRAGIIFLPTDKSSIKALYGRAFRAPSAQDKYGTPGFIQGDTDIEPETIDSYELIYLYKDKRWKINATGFYSFWKNGIYPESLYDVNDPTAQDDYLSKSTNSGENRSYGGELNCFFTWDVYAVELGFSYVMSTALDADNPDYPESESEPIKDVVYDAFPEYSARLALNYFFRPLEINFYLNNRLYFNMYEAPSNTRQVGDTSREKLPTYYRMDLNISRVMEQGLELYLDIRNVPNRENHLPSMMGVVEGHQEGGTSVLLRAGYKL